MAPAESTVPCSPTARIKRSCIVRNIGCVMSLLFTLRERNKEVHPHSLSTNSQTHTSVRFLSVCVFECVSLCHPISGVISECECRLFMWISFCVCLSESVERRREKSFIITELSHLTVTDKRFSHGKVKFFGGHLIATVSKLYRLQYHDFGLDLAENSRGQQTVVSSYDEVCN